MRIELGTIREAGLDLELSLDQPWALAGAALALDGPPEELDGRLHLEREGAVVEVGGQISARFHTTCARCLAPLQLSIEGPVDLRYGPPISAEQEEEEELSEVDLDAGWHDGSGLEAADIVSEQLALLLPVRITCATRGASRVEPGDCQLPEFDPGPDLSRQNPFAKIRLPD